MEFDQLLCYYNENIIFQISPHNENLNRQTSVGNVLACTSSSGSGSSVVGSPHPSLGSANSHRQSSQGSLFEQFTTQAKELVKETKRQSSQDGLLAQVDKVSRINHQWELFVYMLYSYSMAFLFECVTYNL